MVLAFERPLALAMRFQNGVRMVADWKPPTVIFHVTPKLFESKGCVRSLENIDAPRIIRCFVRVNNYITLCRNMHSDQAYVR